MFLVTLCIGHNIGNSPAWTHDDIVDACTDLLPIDGFTAYPAVGMWQGMREDSTVVLVYTDNPDDIVRFVPALAHNLEQDAIACTVQAVSTEFIPAL